MVLLETHHPTTAIESSETHAERDAPMEGAVPALHNAQGAADVDTLTPEKPVRSTTVESVCAEAGETPSNGSVDSTVMDPTQVFTLTYAEST